MQVDLYRLQSEELASGDLNIHNQQNMRFVDAGLSEVVSAPTVGPFTPDSDTSATLGDFLSRPVQINSFTWLETSTAIAQTSFNPWQLYFNDTSVKKKLENFKLLRCRLHLKFVVNASPFYFGSMRVSYCPMASGQDNIVISSDQMKISQLPGLYLEPATMTTAEMELPFLWPNSWLDVVDNNEFLNMGRIRYVLFAKLRSANAVASASVRIACYAWATDVEVAGLTSYLALQSDEYEEDGVISGPATAIADVAGKLKDAPIIGPFATATEKGANIVSSIARLFGYSNPPVISDVMPYAPKSFHAFSSVDTSIPSDKLSLDPKNEVTIDNSVTGAGSEDQLALSFLMRKESFLQGALWQGADAENKILWSAPVTPMYVSQLGAPGSQNIRNYTPASYFSTMFEQWRGSITYRFKFIKSRYHTGRLIITWDPHGVPGNDYETTNLTRIVDLQTEEEAIITVPYKQPFAWLNTAVYANNFSNGATPTFTLDPLAQNGVIQVRVLTTLTGPSTLPEIDILTFVSCGEDYEVSVPANLPQEVSSFALQSQSVEQDELAGERPELVNGLALVTVGESIKTLRTLLHRSSFVEQQPVGNPLTSATTFQPEGLQMCTNLFHRVPRGFGFDDDALMWANKTLSAGSASFNFVANHPIWWVINCFAGYRGSVVHHFNVETNGRGVISYFGAERYDGSPVIDPLKQARNRFTNVAVMDSASTCSRFGVTTTLNVPRKANAQKGGSITNCQTQAALSIVSPQYSAWRFRPAFEPVRDLFPDGSVQEAESVRVDTSFYSTSLAARAPWPMISHYVAAGVDFNPVYFLCTPSLYVVPMPTANDTF